MTFLNKVNSRQLEAIKAVQGPVIIVAGPGSGKTRVLTYRIAYLISIGVPAYQLLALTFTNKAANEMKERITQQVGEKSKQLWMGTFHSIFARLLRIEADRLGFGKNFSIYDTQDRLRLIQSIMNDLHIPSQQYNPQAVMYRISRAKNQVILPEEYASQSLDLFEEKTAKIYAEYVRRLKLNNAMDFDDLLIKPIELFNHHKKILESYQERFRFILIDEYQDTNRAQYVLLKLLAEKYKNICVVGDDAQSIYGFRGADIRNILEFTRDYPEAKIIHLEQNYRSTRAILSAADQVIKKNVNQIPKNLWTENLDGEPITILECVDDKSEGEAIVRNIFREVERLKIQFKDIAIMYRTNAQSRTLEDVLRKNTIPYAIIGGIEFYQRKEVKDVLAYFRLLVNPQDDESFLRIVNYPNRGIGEVAVRHLRNFASTNSQSLSVAISSADQINGPAKKAKTGMINLSSMFEKYRKLKNELSMSELSRALVDELGILNLFKEEGTPEAMARRENVHELLSAISEFAAEQPNATLESFLQEVSLVADVDEWDNEFNAVTLMTLHSAKGLEFPIVFITGLEEGLLPYYNSSLDTVELEEERRLFYVGITRTMNKLFLSWEDIIHNR
ncbi:MAG: UvrD-helicase domain-containing protein [Ignavibacteriales bacterium]|nr:UvrD-helicase domain-containing protein [Ignavibacteriales bacterium]